MPRATVTAQSAFAVRTLPSPVSQLCVSVNVNLASGSAVDMFRLRTAANGAIIKAFIAGNGTVQMRNDLNAATRTTTVALGTGWHNIELCGTVGAASTWTLYRDSVLINTWAGIDTGTTRSASSNSGTRRTRPSPPTSTTSSSIRHPATRR